MEIKIPHILSSVSCGLFGVSEDFSESYQSLDERFIKNQASTFFFKASGNSMYPTIFSGDILLVDRSLENFHRKICIVSYEGKLICKRVHKVPQGIVLKSDHHKYQDILIETNDSVEIWGVVTSRHGVT